MPRMKFSTRAKYKGAYHDALVPFDVDGADVPELQKQGGVLIEEPQNAPDVPEHKDAPKDAKKGKGRKG